MAGNSAQRLSAIRGIKHRLQLLSLLVAVVLNAFRQSEELNLMGLSIPLISHSVLNAFRQSEELNKKAREITQAPITVLNAFRQSEELNFLILAPRAE